MTERLQPSDSKEVSTDAQAQQVGTVKIAVRLLESVNGPLRDLVRYQGELAGFVNDAIRTVDLKSEPLVVIRDQKAKDTTIRVDRETFENLVRIAKERATSLNVLVNTAIAHWLRKRTPRNEVRFRT